MGHRWSALAAVVAIVTVSAVIALAHGQQTPSCTIFVQPGESIQAAIDEAPVGAVICLASGSWNENIRITKSLTLMGAGPNKTIITGKEEGPVVWIATPVILKGTPQTFSVVAGSPSWIIAPKGTPQTVSVTIDGLEITGAYGSCADLGGWGCPEGVIIQGSAQVTVFNSSISGNLGEGIDLCDSAHATISNSTISENEDGISLSDAARVTVSNSTIFGNKDSGIDLEDSARATISDSTISGNTEVDINLSDMAQAAISNSTILGPGIEVGGSAQVTISGSTISKGDNSAGVDGRDSARITISNSVISDNVLGISLEDSAQAAISNSTISKNKGFGICLGVSNPATSSKAQAIISHSTISGNNEYGIVLASFTQAKISNSTISGSKEVGIDLENLARATISGSTVSKNGFGIVLWDSAEAIIETSKIIRNEGYGVALYQGLCFNINRAFSGYVSGKGNYIPGPDKPDGNSHAVCPDKLSFLMTDTGGQLDQRK